MGPLRYSKVRCAPCLDYDSSNDRGPPLSKLSGLLEGVGRLQHAEILVMSPHNLQADRKTLGRKTTRNRNCRQTSQSYRVAGSHPVNVSLHFDAVDFLHPFHFNGKGYDL